LQQKSSGVVHAHDLSRLADIGSDPDEGRSRYLSLLEVSSADFGAPLLLSMKLTLADAVSMQLPTAEGVPKLKDKALKVIRRWAESRRN
jgi:hypothetical protein